MASFLSYLFVTYIRVNIYLIQFNKLLFRRRVIYGVEVGQIVNTHGIKGEVKVKSNSDFTETRFQPGEQLLVKHNNTEIVYTVDSYRIHKGFHMLKFERINNINDIEHLKGDYIYQERDHQDIELGEHEYYYSDIIGCTVFKDDDTPIGRVINILKQVLMTFGL